MDAQSVAAGSYLAHTSTPRTKTATAPQGNVHEIGDPDLESSGNNTTSDSEEAEEGASSSNNQTDGSSSSEGSDSSDDEGSEEDSEEEDEAELERKIVAMRADFVERRKRKQIKRKSVEVARDDLGLSASREQEGVKVEGGWAGVESPEMRKRLKAIVGDHAHSCLTSLCGLKQAKDAAKLVLRYTDGGEPDYFPDNGPLIPHLDRSLQENLKAWGRKYDDITKDPTHMNEHYRDYLKTVPAQDFRDALLTGAFATMVTAWKNNREGQGEAWSKRKNSISRRSNRKIEKSKRRKAALAKSGLPTGPFDFVTHAGFQSSEHSNPDDKSHITVVSPEYRAAKVIKLIDALDVKHKLIKQRTGNRVYTRVERTKTNSPVPALKNPELKVPKWGVSPSWATTNPKLARASRPFIDPCLDTMPSTNEVQDFIYDHEPDDRVYIGEDQSAAIPLISEPTHPGPQAVEATVQPTLQNNSPVPTTVPANQPPLPAPAATSGFSGLNQIPQYTHHPSPGEYPSFPQYVVQPASGDPLVPLPTDLDIFDMPPPNLMLGAGFYNQGFSSVGDDAGSHDPSHPFNCPDETSFQAMMTQGINGIPELPTQSNSFLADNPNNNELSNIVQATESYGGTDATTALKEVARPIRSSGRPRKASARAIEAAEAEAEDLDLELADTAVLRPKLSKAAKARMKGVGKGTVRKKGKGKERSISALESKELAPRSLRAPLDISRIKKITVKKLHGE
ncbi:hypothetical protein FRC09_004372 [Ceratobasidium sp. 395]|nr:hypothetical protein FRC09_004372 [Ceratobasidium sp. 395]